MLLAFAASAAPRWYALHQTQTWGPPWEAAQVRWWALALVAAGVLALALLVLLLAMAGASLMPAALAQRLAFAGWFGWWLWAGRLSRASPSGRG